MNSSVKFHAAARWPFWLLLVAWFCANSPQTLTFDLVVWLGNARHFAHQDRLAQEVVSVLSGDENIHFHAVADPNSAKPFAPAVPADATLKKIELAIGSGEIIWPPMEWIGLDFRTSDVFWGKRLVEPLDEPPRALLAA